jgi:outer membrane protein assembly factor BamA
LRFEGNYNVTDLKYLERKVTFGYLEPYLLDTRTRGRASYTLSDSVSDFNNRKANQLSQTTFSLEQDVTSHVLVTYDVLSLAAVKTKFIDTDVTTSELNISSTGPTLDVDFRDHPFNPTKGTFSRFNIEYSSPEIGSTKTIEFVRSIISFTHYQSVVKPSLVFANSFRVGYLKNLNTLEDGGVPYDKKGLILGGQSTIRGFQPGESFPNSNDFKLLDAAHVVNDEYNLKTEAQMVLIKSELRFPIKGNIGGAVFYDGGAVYVKGVDFPDPYRDTVGVAFRYATPVGAVSLEWGWKLDRRADRNENQFPFHFSIGTF